MEKVDARDKFIGKHECLNAAYFNYSRKLPVYNKHDGYEICAHISGSARCFIEGRQYDYRKGDVSFVAEGTYHGTLVRDRCKFASIHVKPALLFSHPSLLELFLRPFSGDTGFYKIRGKPALAEAIASFVPFYEKNRDDLRALTERLTRLMRHFEAFPARKKGAASAEKERFRPAMSLMYERFSGDLKVEDLARACSLSRAAFYRRFSAAYGSNPKTMLNDIRLHHAMALLTGTAKKITEIAYDSGFFSLSNFNRVFMEKTGVTPKEYRKNAKP
jgi:AraC-like DNA-binding protein